jgi:hypothetical protein
VRIQTLLSEAQNGQAFANLARAFHLPPAKVEVAVGAMIDELTTRVGIAMQSRRSLARLVELLGQGTHEKVLESPELLGATATQVNGNKALNVIAGRNDSNRIAQHAASVAGVSEMIAEYLLPVIAAMMVGLLAKVSRPGFETIIGGAPGGASASGNTSGEANSVSLQLPRVSGGVGFSGSTGGSAGVTSSAVASSHYIELAEDIRRGDRTPSTPDPAEAVRRVLAPIMGFPSSPIGWLDRMRWSAGAFKAFLAGIRR